MSGTYETRGRTLSERVDDLISTHKDERALYSMHTHAAVAELFARNTGVEEAIARWPAKSMTFPAATTNLPAAIKEA